MLKGENLKTWNKIEQYKNCFSNHMKNWRIVWMPLSIQLDPSLYLPVSFWTLNKWIQTPIKTTAHCGNMSRTVRGIFALFKRPSFQLKKPRQHIVLEKYFWALKNTACGFVSWFFGCGWIFENLTQINDRMNF